MFDCAIIGGGAVGLATAESLGKLQPGIKLVVVEKEDDLALHQTGRNSGVIHSGIYYQPGSLKAQFARRGNLALVSFCREHGIPHEICGKVIVATKPSELPVLEKIYQRGLENGLRVSKLRREEVLEIEPGVSCVAGIRVLDTGIVNYRSVCRELCRLIQSRCGFVRTGTAVRKICRDGSTHLLATGEGEIRARFLINCAGLQSDRIARQAGFRSGARIVPFRGEYFEVVPEKRHLVKNLIYPVPNPDFPFLGVHFTRMIDGAVHAGPSAVLAFKREGYRRRDLHPRDLWDTVTFGGFWKLLGKHYKEAALEMHRSLSKRAFVRSLQQLVPAIRETDLVRSSAGVRAQALGSDGRLVDDFLILEGRNSIHVCNAPSPAATACLEIGRYVAEKIPPLRG